MSRFKALSKLFGTKLDDASKVLEKIDNPELATSLTGDTRSEYLDALTEIYGPQSKRAKDMGFGTRDWYHGTSVDIPEFQKEALGLSTNAQSAKKGFFFASDPSTASDYAELAKTKGIVREGDKVTTKSLYDIDYKSLVSNDIYEQENLRNKYKEKIDNLQLILNKIKNSNNPDDIEKTLDLEEKMLDYQTQYSKIEKEIKYLENLQNKFLDKEMSGGQNLIPVRLKGNKDSIHVKNYKGQGYRDTTYADEMTKAQEQGKEGVLFKNTYDPADPQNRVKQDVAAVFEPNQIRSKFAAFDPRFKDSALLMAGAGAIPQANVNPMEALKGIKENIAEPVVERYNKLKSYLTRPLAQQMNLSKDPEVEKNLKMGLDMGLDPVNLVPGGAGVGAGLLQMLGEKDEEDE